MAATDGKKPAIDEATAGKLLSEARERVEAELKRAERDRSDEIDGIADEVAAEDDAGLIGEKSVDDALLSDLRRRLEAIERAEKRLAEGTYGLSVDSGEPIPKERLQAIPWAERTKDEQEG
jgi:DnaK suppressor protein